LRLRFYNRMDSEPQDRPTPKPQPSGSPPQPPRGPTVATGSCGGDDDIGDPVAEEKTWREELQMLQAGTEAIEGNAKADLNPAGFYVVCVGGLDAATHFVKPESFASRAVFLAELRRLMIEPTLPSRPVPSIEEYQRAQKRWLELIVKKYDPVG
jgi:hypothetical protein